MNRTVDDLILVEEAMTEEERQSFLARWAELNPRSRDSVAAILGNLVASDAHVDIVDAIIAANRDIDADHERWHIATLATIYAYREEDVVCPQCRGTGKGRGRWPVGVEPPPCTPCDGRGRRRRITAKAEQVIDLLGRVQA